MLGSAMFCLKQWRIMTCRFDTFFEMAGFHNDINVLQCSLVYTRLVDSQALECTMTSMATNMTKGTI